MLYLDFVNPYLVYAFFVLLTAFLANQIFVRKEFLIKNKKNVLIIATVLLVWTQYVRYVDLLFFGGEFKMGEHLPCYMCRVSAVVLLYYTITGDKRVETFLFYWGALGLAGVIYPNGPINNIMNLTEVFYIDHVMLTLIPIFLVVVQGYRPSVKGVFIIVGVMAIMLLSFIPINNVLGADYFYLANQSIFGIMFPNAGVIAYIITHCTAAGLFFYGIYKLFRNYDVKVFDNNENRIIY